MRSVPSIASAAAAVTVFALGSLAACGVEDSEEAASSPTGGASTAPGDDATTARSDGERAAVVVTTSILGDIVAEVLGDQADVEVIMPLGSDPHDFAASSQQAEAMEEADLLVINGAGFEEGLLGVIEGAEESGAPVFSFADNVELIESTGEHTEDDEHAEEGAEHAEGEGEHAEEGAEDAEEEHSEDEHADGSADPHIWTDPSRMATAVEAFADRAAEIDGIDAEAIGSQSSAYVDELNALATEIEERLADVPAERRVLVTNHEVFGYFADRYDFDVIGAVIPSLTTSASASAADIEALADLISEREVPAIFGETTQPTQLAEALASEAGSDVEVVELFTESLGEDGSGAETYVTMMQLNAERIGDALA